MQKTDCYWYAEEHDMNARIPYCKLDPTDPYDQVMKCNSCKNYHSKWRPTNADRVRAMTDEELAMWINDVTTNALSVLALGSNKQTKTVFYWLEWLKKEAGE